MSASSELYVECAECGHPVELHGMWGCEQLDECGCDVGWKVRQIRELRRAHGLPARWAAGELA